MKLGNEEIKKIALSVMLFAFVLWTYFALLLGPLQTNEKKAAEGIQTLEPQIRLGREQLTKTANLEKQAPVSTAALDQLKATIPDGAPIAWFPPRMADFFKRHGIDKCSTRLVSEEADAGMPGFRKLVWAVDVPKVDFILFGGAVATLENEEPLLSILNLSVEESSHDDPQHEHAVLTVSTLVKS